MVGSVVDKEEVSARYMRDLESTIGFLDRQLLEEDKATLKAILVELLKGSTEEEPMAYTAMASKLVEELQSPEIYEALHLQQQRHGGYGLASYGLELLMREGTVGERLAVDKQPQVAYYLTQPALRH